MEEKLRDSQLAFIGKILSTATHEFKNHLAIINESAGLMGDILSIDASVDPDKRERYLKIVQSIAARVDKASDMTLQLNYFGHRLDLPMAQFNINELLAEELRLIERMAAQKQLAFSTDFAEVPALNSYPGICQYVFFKVIDYAFCFGTVHSTLGIKTSQADDGIQVAVVGPGLNEAELDQFEQVKDQCGYALEKISGRLEFDPEKEEITLLLVSLEE